MSPLGFKPTISSGERSQTYALDRAATGTGSFDNYRNRKFLTDPKALTHTFNTPNAHNPRNEVKICVLQIFVMQILVGEIILFDTENKGNISSHAIIFTIIQSPICPPAFSTLSHT